METALDKTSRTFGQIHLQFVKANDDAPPSRPELPRLCPDRGNAGGAIVFFPPVVMVIICNRSVYLAAKFT